MVFLCFLFYVMLSGWWLVQSSCSCSCSTLGTHGVTCGKMCDDWKFCMTGEMSHGCGGEEDSSSPHTTTTTTTTTTTYYNYNYYTSYQHHLALQPLMGFRLLSQVSPCSSILSCLLPIFNLQLFLDLP